MDTHQKNSNWFKRHKILTILIVVFVVIPVIAMIASGGEAAKTTNTSNQATPKYEAVVENYQVQDPATLTVRVKAHNVGNAPSKPSCTVTADNGSGAYRGFDTFVREQELEPNGYWGFNGNVTITNQGASYVKDLKVECK